MSPDWSCTVLCNSLISGIHSTYTLQKKLDLPVYGKQDMYCIEDNNKNLSATYFEFFNHFTSV